MNTLLTVSAVSKLANRSRSSVHRDIRSGTLATAQKVPGYHGAYLIDEQVARETYGIKAAEA